jgi:hypothetical protein
LTTNYLAIRRHYPIWPLEGISTARINPENEDAIIVLETGHPSLATKTGSHWVLWQTGICIASTYHWVLRADRDRHHQLTCMA